MSEQLDTGGKPPYEEPGSEALNPLSAFAALRRQIAGTEDAVRQQALVEAWVSAYPASPLVAADQALIYYMGPAQSVVLRGDMLQDRSEPLQRLEQTSLWFYSGCYERDARLDYHLLVDGVDLGDPRNPRQAPSGYGPRAELCMPDYAAPDLWSPRADVPKGTIKAFEQFGSEHYPATRTIWIYTPPGYDPDSRYPSVYFHDGGDYLNFGGAQANIDNLIATGALRPCIAVFIDPSDEHGRVCEYDLNRDYCRFVAEELVPWVDQRYATERASARRAIVGPSFGGLIALYTAVLHPDVFGLVVSQSGFVGRKNAAVMQMYAQAAPAPIVLHLIVGTYETRVGATELEAAEVDFLAANRAFRDMLQLQGYRYEYAEYHESHSWGLWRARLGDALTFLFNF